MKNLILILVLAIFTVTGFSQEGYVIGSNFGSFFKASCVYNQTKTLIEHTSKESVELHGEEKLTVFYRNLEISKQETWDFVITEGSGDTVSQSYTRSLKGAYSKEVTLNLVKEDGEWKIVLPEDLTTFLK